MGLKLKAANKLRNRGVDHEGIENIHMVADEDARAGGIEARRAADFEFHAGEAQDIAEEGALQANRFCGDR